MHVQAEHAHASDAHEAELRVACLLWRVRSEGSAKSICPLSLRSWGRSLPTGSTEKSWKIHQSVFTCIFSCNPAGLKIDVQRSERVFTS